MNWYKKSQNSGLDKIIWAIDEIWLTSGLLSGDVFELILQKHMGENKNYSLPKAAQKITKNKKPTPFPFPINQKNKNDDYDEIAQIIEEKKQDINFIFSYKKIADIAKMDVKTVTLIIQKMGVDIHSLVLERRKKVEDMIAEFVLGEGAETFRSVRVAHERFMEKTGHNIHIAQTDVYYALQFKNIQLGYKGRIEDKNNLFSAFRAFLNRQTNSTTTVQDIVNSDLLYKKVDLFVDHLRPEYGFIEPEDKEQLKQELIRKMQLRNRTREYMGEGDKFYNAYFSQDIINKIISLMNSGLEDSQIASQLQLDPQKVKNVVQIYNLRTSPFDMGDMGIDKTKKQPPKMPEAINKYIGRATSNSKGNVKISKKWVDRLHGGKADDKTPDDFPKEDVDRGRKIEREHSNDPDIAREISLDHLCEHPNYYAGLEHMENLLTELEQEDKKKK